MHISAYLSSSVHPTIGANTLPQLSPTNTHSNARHMIYSGCNRFIIGTAEFFKTTKVDAQHYYFIVEETSSCAISQVSWSITKPLPPLRVDPPQYIEIYGDRRENKSFWEQTYDDEPFPLFPFECNTSVLTSLCTHYEEGGNSIISNMDQTPGSNLIPLADEPEGASHHR